MIKIIHEKNYFKNINLDEIYAKLVEIFGSTNVTNKQVDLYPYSYDMTENEAHMPDFIVIPENTDQLINLIKFIKEHEGVEEIGDNIHLNYPDHL